MLIKAHAGDGIWELFPAAGSVRFSDTTLDVPNQDVTFDCSREPDGADDSDRRLDYCVDFHVPHAKWLHHFNVHEHERITRGAEEPPPERRREHWVYWVNADGDDHTLITDSVVFLCNERGDTIESLR